MSEIDAEQLRLLFRSAVSTFPPHDQQHAIAFDLLANLLNLLAATSPGPAAKPPPRGAVPIDDMDDDELFFHVLQQELTSVNRHFEESAGATLAQWAAHNQDTSGRSMDSTSSRDSHGCTASCNSSRDEDDYLHQRKARQVRLVAAVVNIWSP